MSDPLIQYDVSRLKKIPKLIRTLEKRGVKVDVPLKEWGIYMVATTKRTFTTSGRGAVSWAPLSDVTIKIRKSKGITGTKPLIARGGAKRSIQSTLLRVKRQKAQAVFTRLKYMAIHQTGGVKTTKHGKTIKIPKRQFLFITAQDRQKMLALLVDHERKILRGIRGIK